jgi:hypothetical protein
MENKNFEDVVVIDDFLSESYFKLLQNAIREDMPWGYMNNVTHAKKPNENVPEKLGSIGFSHGFILRGPEDDQVVIQESARAFLTMPALMYMKDYIGATEIFSARYDMTVYNPEKYLHSAHIDCNYRENYVSAILYMEDSDGETVIYNEKCHDLLELRDNDHYTIKKTVEPKANRLVLFAGHLVHSGHSPSKHKNRVLLNALFDLDPLKEPTEESV